jgi:hypothetical protein
VDYHLKRIYEEAVWALSKVTSLNVPKHSEKLQKVLPNINEIKANK